MTVAEIQPFVNLGAVGVIALILLRFVVKQQNILVEQLQDQNKFFIHQMGEIEKSVRQLACNVGMTFLNAEQAIAVFEWHFCMNIVDKCQYFADVLEKNEIHEKRAYLETEIRAKLQEFTYKNVSILASFNTPFGDLAHDLREFNFDEYLPKVYSIFFDKRDNEMVKIRKLKQLMHDNLTYCKKKLINRAIDMQKGGHIID